MDRTTEVSLPQLIARLNGEPPAERFHAALTLGRMGRKARKAVPALIEALKDSDKNVRRAAALALAGIGPDAREAVPGLCEVVRNDPRPPSAGVRRWRWARSV
jgi:HEAT repeat protein